MFARECSPAQGDNASQCAKRVGPIPSLYGFVQRGSQAFSDPEQQRNGDGDNQLQILFFVVLCVGMLFGMQTQKTMIRRKLIGAFKVLSAK